MNIAYVFAYFGEGGAEDHALLLAEKAKQAGHNPLFIIGEFTESSQKRLDQNQFKYIVLPMKSSFRPIKMTKSVAGLKKIIKSEKIQIVHTHMLREQSLAIIAKITGAKFVLIRTFHRFDQFNQKMSPLMPAYRKYTDAFISISEGMSEYMAKNGIDKKVTLVKNGVKKVEVSNHLPAIGFIGRLTNEKGILKFINANIDIFKSTKLVIAGDGPDKSAIEKVIADNKLNIEMLGRVSNKADFYNKISVLALPSDSEVLPLVVLEAYSCGLPVVAFSIDSLRFLIGDKNGKLIDDFNYEKMGETCILLIDLAKNYEKENLDRFNQEFSADIMWSKTAQLYQSLIS